MTQRSNFRPNQPLIEFLGIPGLDEGMTTTNHKRTDMTPNTTYLYDYITGEHVGIATDEQIAASKATDTGEILIDTRTDEVVAAGSWAANDAGNAGALQAVFTI